MFQSIGFIGCGNMGGALARSVAKSFDGSILLSDKDRAKSKALAEEIGAIAAGGNALAAACELGADPGEAANALVSTPPMCGRMERIYRGEFTVIRDFAHTPSAMRRALAFARSQCRGRLVCVFGCGGDRDKGKRPMMGEIGGRLADHCILTSDNP